MELEQTIRDWGAPEWATPAVAAWIRSGGTIDRDLWIALRAAAREAPNDRPGRRAHDETASGPGYRAGAFGGGGEQHEIYRARRRVSGPGRRVD